jgi:DNA-binding NtrC family response regulator
MRILVVEDEESLRITLAANLELEGYQVIEASDGKEALEILKREAVDLVMSDIRMPNMSGVDLLLQVKNTHPELPFLLMTAYAMEDEVDAAICQGVFTVLRKPFDFNAAIAAIVRALQHPVVLIVDDDEADAMTLAECLRVGGLRAAAVYTGADAVSVIRGGTVDVCVTDLVMPDMDGAALAEHVRTIIVYSGHDVPTMIQRASSARVFACLRKPLDPAELMRKVAKARGGAWAI